MASIPDGWEGTRYGVAEDLKALITEIHSYCENNKLILIYGWPAPKNWTDNIPTIYWDREAAGTDYKKFFEAAKRLEVKTVYLYGIRVLNDEIAAANGHKGEFYELALWFIHNNLRYITWLDANWYLTKVSKSPSQSNEQLTVYR